MNRLLAVPAGCCLAGFVVLLVTLHVATGRETATEAARSRVVATDLGRELAPPPPSNYRSAPQSDQRLSAADAEPLLTALSGEYIGPWKKWAESPQRLYSRIAVSPIPSISAEVALSPNVAEDDAFLLASIGITTGPKKEAVPCVVDRTTRQVRLFVEDKWVAGEEWLKQAPQPYGRRREQATGNGER
jgi:hypothetical protein